MLLLTCSPDTKDGPSVISGDSTHAGTAVPVAPELDPEPDARAPAEDVAEVAVRLALL